MAARICIKRGGKELPLTDVNNTDSKFGIDLIIFTSVVIFRKEEVQVFFIFQVYY